MTKKILVLLALLLLTTLPVFGQDTDTPTADIPAATIEATSAPTEEVSPVATLEILPTDAATQTPDVVTSTPQATPIVIVITPPPAEPPAPPTTTGTNDPLYLLVMVIVLGLFAISAVDRWTNYKLSKTAISQVPPEWLPVIQQGLETAQRQVYERAGNLTKETPGVWDDNLLNEEMKRAGWELYLAADGVQHARKVAPAAPGTPAG